MARPNTFTTDTVLYNIHSGERRTFPKGETDPGNAWSEKKGGDTAGASTTTQALKDLIAAQEQIEALQAAGATQDTSMAELAGERDAAVGKVAGLEQAAIEADRARDQALDDAKTYMTERDQAREASASLRAAIATLEGDLAGASKARDEANENATLYAEEVQKLGDRVKELEAEVAKVDGDGDGKVGGRKSKPAEPA